MTIYEFAAERGDVLADTDKLILKRLCEVKGTEKEKSMLDAMYPRGKLHLLWTAYRAYEAQQNAKQIRLFW